LYFNFSYNTDLLGFEQALSNNISSSNGITFTISGSPEIRADANGLLASIGFRVYLTKDSVTTIDVVSRIDTMPGPCGSVVTTSIESSSAAFNYSFICGERAIQDGMNGFLPMKIISLRPNPAQDEIIIDVVAPAFSRSGGGNSDWTAESRPYYVFDALGKQVYSGTAEISLGTNEIHLDTKNLSGGMYMVRIGSESRSFVKVR